MRLTRRKKRQIGQERFNYLMDVALSTSEQDRLLGQQQAKLARKIWLKFNLNIPYYFRQLFCHGCKNLIIPGYNCRIRLSKVRKGLNITCYDCGFIYRKLLS